jgi:transcriptional regulator with XRE-family HTH domain
MKLKYAVGNAVKRIRQQQGMTMRQLEPMVSKGHLSTIEHGVREPSISMLETISEALEVTPSYLLKEVARELDEDTKDK